MTKETKAHKNEIRINNLEHKVGITENGMLTGNGLIGEVKDIESGVELLHEKLNKISAMQTELSLRFDVLENDIKELSKSLEIVKNEMKDNISFRTILKAKNIFIGAAAVLLALSTIGSFVATIYEVLKK